MSGSASECGSAPAPRLIAGNLDCEVDFAATADRSVGDESAKSRPGATLPRKVLQVISSLATLLRGAARDGDILWTPLAVDAARMLPVSGLAQPRLQTGSLPAALDYERLLAWGETERVAEWRRRAASRPDARVDLADRAQPLHDTLWRLPAPPPQVAATSNDRSATLAMAQQLGCTLPGTAVARSLSDVEAKLRAMPAADGAWILKAPFSAAGRLRLVGRGRKLDDAIARRQATRLLALFGALLLEPWVERTGDFGCGAVVTATDVRVVTMHATHVDGYGRFRGLTLIIGVANAAPGLQDAERARLIEVTVAVGRHLQKHGYRGSFGVDAWRYDGDERFQPLGEVNARMTFGIVARCLAERLQAVHRWPKGTLLRLGFSTDGLEEPQDPAVRERIPLVAAAPPDGVAAWVDVIG